MFVTPTILALLVFLAFILGLCMGSFINCAALRRQRGESVLRGRSHCQSCGHTLSVSELVPVLSWLIQGGTCKHCGSRLSLRYPITELLCGLVFAAIVWTQAASPAGLSLRTIEFLIFACLLLYLSLVDLDSRTIPDWCIIVALLVHVVYLVIAGPVLGQIDTRTAVIDSLVGGFAIALPLTVVVMVADRVFKRDSMGGGDIKLFFVAGVYFGWQQCLFLIMFACIIGIIMALVSQRKLLQAGEARQEDLSFSGTELQERGQTEDADYDDSTLPDRLGFKPIRFGPAIAAACVIIMLIGNELNQWYNGLF
ncbi:MAG: prepilin peptidase [Eggerthellaceae bacterium]|nr:prepilin peptidase [Eggerthellaceae bacterium]